MKDLAAALTHRRAQHLYRARTTVDAVDGVHVIVNGVRLLNFCSNDYLGLARHPDVVTALQQGAARYGVGSTAAHLVCGHHAPHHALEEELAAFVGYPRALLFSTGYMANLGIASALLDRHAAVFEDRLNHASLLDAGLSSDAQFKRYAHNDVAQLRTLLSASTSAQNLIMTDSIFSMDGDLAPLPALVECAREHNAQLMIDDAHGFGVSGAQGRGALEQFALSSTDVPIYMATLGKALGCFGAFVAGSEELIETLIQESRPYIYTTATPPALAEATRASLRVVQTESWRREHLRELISTFRGGAQQLGLRLLDSATPIQPIIFGEAADALAASEKLRAQGVWVSAIRPPTVPAGSARLRVTLSAAHSIEHVERLLCALENAA
ncbi:MAG: 8-amino-7-oxononanoate synthase [Gammaproteobacteria bacterium]|nr:8-amino-7-oxononanoate synthase [Gammaproteobacteria bacterium]